MGLIDRIPSKNKYARVIAAISNAIDKDLIDKGLKNTSLICNGIKTNEIEIKNTFNSIIQIVCIGRLNHTIKGQDILLRAFSLLKLQKNIGSIKLNFIGEGSSENYLKKLTQELNLENDVIFHGSKSRTELYNMIKDFDILVELSIHEGFGLTV